MAQERLDRLNLAWIQFEQAPGNATATSFLREIHTLKGEAGLTGFSSVNRLLHKLEDLVQALVKTGGPPEPSAGDLVMRGLDVAATVIKRAPESESPEVSSFIAELARPAPDSAGTAPATPAPTPAAAAGAPEPAPRRREGVRLTAEKLDGLRDLVAELLLTRVRLERSATELRNAKESAHDLRRRESAIPDGQLLRQLTQLGELLTGLESRLRDEGHQVGLLVSQLDSATRDLRMVPLSSLLDRYPVAVRGLARRLGKQVQLRTEGEATEVDREVLERLDEPLLHLVQNAVDHGIEAPERRQRQGKPAEATLVPAQLAGGTDAAPRGEGRRRRHRCRGRCATGPWR